MAYCGERSLVKQEGDFGVAVTLKCRSWHCPNCQDTRKKQVTCEAIAGRPSLFLTLTSRRVGTKTPNDAAKELTSAWRILRKRLMRKYRVKRMPFFAVIEATKAGWPHLHILLRFPYLDIFYIRDFMRSVINSPHQWIEKISIRSRVAQYCAKYCSKAVHKFGTAKRYWQTPDYDLREPFVEPLQFQDQQPWEIRAVTLTTLKQCWELAGYYVFQTAQHRIEYAKRPPP